MPSPDSQTVKYLRPEDAPLILYALVKEFYVNIPNHPLPDYSREDNGAIAGVLTQIQNDDYYPEFWDKASHLFCHIVTGHIFSNGNKRLGFVTALLFLGLNRYFVEDGVGLKNLALQLADNAEKGIGDYDLAKQTAREFFESNALRRA